MKDFLNSNFGRGYKNSKRFFIASFFCPESENIILIINPFLVV